MERIKSFNNNPVLKKKCVDLAQFHQDADNFIQGNWLSGEQNGDFEKGCGIGCMTQVGKSEALQVFSEKYHIDLWYVHLIEKIFEGLSDLESKTLIKDAFEVVPVGFDFDKCKSLFHFRVLMDDKKGQIGFCETDEQRKAVTHCAKLFKVHFSEIQESTAELAAESAAESAWSAAESAHYKWLRDLLFDCIEKTKCICDTSRYCVYCSIEINPTSPYMHCESCRGRGLRMS